MDKHQKFKQEVAKNIRSLGEKPTLKTQSYEWIKDTAADNYTYNFSWLGRPIIQVPQDIVAMQELIWEIKPDLIIETGIAHGGSIIFSASMLAQLDMCEAIQSGQTIDPKKSKRKVLAIDIDIREHNRDAIECHPMASRIEMIQGSSIDPDIVNTVKTFAKQYSRIMVCLDSNHTHEHVLAELEAYANLTSVGSYCVVFDTVIDDMPENMFPNRPWGPGNNPKTAVWEYLKSHPEFEIDKSIHDKLLITVAPDGFLKRTK
ncbi:Cephalosporin hydroxylase [Paraglaciecola sp. T6c]|uniref:cephalosporin hydroxylase family protein n=1 Tax=Pseudoalteromonas atlantica (strain T6c / ATCC BAA-1087) TaxID=3042615 RepID=UPI00005C6794|nr:cephalosporin hydroxylase family protein [Paraglaciecola sp. T6c]ABG41561.1 Cephalosporin hydroxylase [Paraglaciecola sp. T6c]